MFSTYGPGYSGAAPAERGSLFKPRTFYLRRGGVLFAHMYGASATIVFDSLYGPPARHMAEGSFVFAGDFAGTTSWGNDDAIARMDDGLAFLQAAGIVGDTVGLASYSMGTYTVLNWAHANLEAVSAIALMLPAPGLDMVHDGYPTLTTPIETAYGGAAGYASALATHDYVNFIEDFDGIPMTLYADTTDPFYVGLPDGGADFPEHYSYITDAVSTAEIVTFSGGGHTLDGLDPTLPAEFLQEYA